MDNGVIYEGHFVKGHFHGEGKLVYPNVMIHLFREASTKQYGRTVKWSKDSTSSTITFPSKKIIGSTASMTIEDFTKSTSTASNLQEPLNKPDRTNPILFPQEHTIQETDTMNLSKASFILSTVKY